MNATQHVPPTMALCACPRFIELGQFRFECQGHVRPYLRHEAYAARWNGGKVEHRSASPRDFGDVEVTWWTEVPSGQLRGDAS